MKKNNGTIIYIGGFELPDLNAAAHLVLNNAKIFSDLGYEVVFCGITKNSKENIKSINGYSNYPINYPRTTKEWIKYMTDVSYYKKIIKQEKNVKYIITYNMHFIPLIKLINFCHKKNIKVIANLTEWYENKLSFKPIDIIKYFDTKFVMGIANKKVDAIIAISNFLKDTYKNSVSNIVVIPPLIDIKEKKWINNNKKECRSIIEFVYVGNIETKNRKDKLTTILNCFYKTRERNNFRFTIAGVEKEAFLKEFPSYEKILYELSNKVVFKGRISHVDSIEILKNSDFTIIIRNPTRKNNAGFPTKFVEGWTSGINIISSNISDVSYYFPKDDKSILLNDNKEDSIEKAIRDSLDLDDAILKKRRNGLKNNPFYYKKWEEIIRKFINSIK